MPRYKMPRNITLEFAAIHKEEYYTTGKYALTMTSEDRSKMLHHIRAAQKRMLSDPQYKKDLELPEYSHVGLGRVERTEEEVKKGKSEYMRNYRMSRPEEDKEQSKEQARLYARTRRREGQPEHNLVGQKVCSSCKETKLFSEFMSDSRTLDGVAVRCQKCAATHVQSRKPFDLIRPIDAGDKKLRQRLYTRTYMREYRAKQKEQARGSI